MYIPDPIELMEAAMEEEMWKIDGGGLYPCAGCGVKQDPDEMIMATDSPSSPLICSRCAEAANKVIP